MIIDFDREVFYEGQAIKKQVGLDIALTTENVVTLRPVTHNSPHSLGVANCHISIPVENLPAVITALEAIRDRAVT